MQSESEAEELFELIRTNSVCETCKNVFSLSTGITKIHCTHRISGKTFAIYVCRPCHSRKLYMKALLAFQEKCNNCKTKDICEVCGNKFSLQKFLKKHCLTYAEDPKQLPVICEKCIKRLSREKNLTVHCLTNPSIEKVFNCSKCKLSFFSQNDLNTHLFICAKPNPSGFENAGFKSEVFNSQVWSYMNKQENYHYCEICNRKLDISDKSKLCSPCKATLFFENMCRKNNIVNRKLSNRVLKMHCLDLPSDNPYSCGVCEKKFSSKTALFAHYSLHSEKYVFRNQITHNNNSTKTFISFAEHKETFV